MTAEQIQQLHDWWRKRQEMYKAWRDAQSAFEKHEAEKPVCDHRNPDGTYAELPGHKPGRAYCPICDKTWGE